MYLELAYLTHEVLTKLELLCTAVWITLRNMFHMIMQKMRQRRIERGALTLASAEVKFQIDTETHDPLDIGMLSE